MYNIHKIKLAEIIMGIEVIKLTLFVTNALSAMNLT